MGWKVSRQGILPRAGRCRACQTDTGVLYKAVEIDSGGYYGEQIFDLCQACAKQGVALQQNREKRAEAAHQQKRLDAFMAGEL